MKEAEKMKNLREDQDESKESEREAIKAGEVDPVKVVCSVKGVPNDC